MPSDTAAACSEASQVAASFLSRGLPASSFRRSFQPPPTGSAFEKSVEAHDLAPGRHEVVQEAPLRTARAVAPADPPQLGFRAEDEIGDRAGPLEFTGLAIAALQHAFGGGL